MTETPYLEDPYLQRIEATVERSLDDRVVLDRTTCYPEGGGQPADRGRLRVVDGAGDDTDGRTNAGVKEGTNAGANDESSDATAATDGDAWEIVDVQKQDTIYHHLEPATGAEAGTPATPPEGATVEVDLDWERRHGHMRHHTAQHLLSRVLIDDFDAGTEGNQVYADGARIDCEQGRFGEDDLAAIEARVDELIDDERAVEWYELDRETAEERLDPERTRIELLPDSITEIRIVEIEGFDRTACAGTHVENTRECCRFELTGRESKGDDVERLRFELA